MRTTLLILALALTVHASTDEDIQKQWRDFQANFSKTYRSTLEAQNRFSIFKKNLEKIEEHNNRFANGEVSYTKGLNQFADWTSEEFLEYINKYKIPPHTKNEQSVQMFEVRSNSTIPDSVDWRRKGCVTEVKNQESCGAAWAFSATGALEAQLYLKKGELISLSEQNLIDCSYDQENAGCRGGLMRRAFLYVQENGCESEADYPFIANSNDYCGFEKNKSKIAISGYVRIRLDENDLQVAVATVGPISVAIEATEALQAYSSGILEDESCSSSRINHAVLLVGYGSENGKDYYILKNSWGGNWGEQGFFKLGNRGSNPCGIIQDASYPLVI